MAKQNDQVFQLSLTEIAFTLIFILLLLLGFLLQKGKQQIEEMKSELERAENLTVDRQAFEAAKTALTQALATAGITDPNQVISKLVESQKNQVQQYALREQAQDLDSKLTALSELKKSLEKNSGVNIDKIDETVESALALSSQLKTKLKTEMNQEVPSGKELQALNELINKAKEFEQLNISGVKPEQIQKENSDLKGQVVFLRNRLEAKGGRDYPPCWADESTGKVQTLFTIDLRQDGVAITPAWPLSRESDAKALPGLEEIIGNVSVSYKAFPDSVAGIFMLSNQQSCRHFVNLKSSISDAVQSDRARLMVESYFYKIEVRR